MGHNSVNHNSLDLAKVNKTKQDVVTSLGYYDTFQLKVSAVKVILTLTCIFVTSCCHIRLLSLFNASLSLLLRV